MKHLRLLITAFAFGLFFYIPNCTIANAQNAASVETKANLRQAQHLMDKGDYEGAISKLNRVLLTDANNAEAKRLFNQCNQFVEQQRQARERAELEAFNKAKNDGSKYALNAFISSYPNSKYAPDARAMIEDYDLWITAQQLNTIDSYQSYLQQSANRSYADEAAKRIQDIESENEWNRVRYSNNVDDLQRFTTNYPQSPHSKEASVKVHELKGEQYFNAGNLSQAYSEFTLAGGRYALTYSNQQRYDKAKDYYEYSSLSKYDEQAMLNYLSSHPTSEYRNEVSNNVAKVRANKFSAYSGEREFNNALLYATDSETRDYVKSRIKSSKKQYSLLKRQERIDGIKEKWGKVSFGVDFWDIGFNTLLSSEDNRSWNYGYYDVNLTLRIGSYKAPVYLEIGAKPGLLIYTDNTDDSYMDYDTYDYYLDDDYINNQYSFHMPLFAKMKINLFNAWGSTKAYINGAGYYHAIREEKHEPSFSIGGGFGVAGEHWDWQILYYRQGLNKDYKYNKNDLRFLGTTLGYFF